MAGVAAEQRHLSVLDEIKAVVRQLALGAVVAAAQAANAVREIDSTIGLHDDVVRAAEALAVIPIGEYGARAVLFDSDDSSVRHRADDEAPLRVQRQRIRSNEENSNATAGDGLLTHVQVVFSGISRAIHMHCERLAALPAVNAVRRDVAEEQVAVRPVLDPDRAFGEPES